MVQRGDHTTLVGSLHREIERFAERPPGGRGLGHRFEGNEHRTIRERRCGLPGDLDCKSRLPRATRPRESHHAVANREISPKLFDLTCTTNDG